jgi:hypothetical protein
VTNQNLIHSITVGIPCFLMIEYVALWFPVVQGVAPSETEKLMGSHFSFPLVNVEICHNWYDELAALFIFVSQLKLHLVLLETAKRKFDAG